MPTPEELKNIASDRKRDNSVLFRKLKRKKPPDLDLTVKRLHRQVFEKIDCLECANCCKTISPILIDKDIQRISKKLKIKLSEFADYYLKEDVEGDFVFKESPCPFLMSDNYCSIYEVRPRACREYPHTDRKRFFQILDLTLKNTYVCPAVLEIVAELKKKHM